MNHIPSAESAAEAELKSSRPRRGIGWILGLTALLLVYALSPMPVQLFLNSHRGHPRWIEPVCETVYAPLDWASDHCKPIDTFYAWYEGQLFEWWMARRHR